VYGNAGRDGNPKWASAPVARVLRPVGFGETGRFVPAWRAFLVGAGSGPSL